MKRSADRRITTRQQLSSRMTRSAVRHEQENKAIAELQLCFHRVIGLEALSSDYDCMRLSVSKL
jgi:hypothetical protein